MDANFSLFEIGVPDYLILRARATDAPGAEVSRDVIGPAFVGNLNFLVTGLDPKNYFFDLYESADGTTLTQLLGTFTYDVKNLRTVDELRFYVVDSGVNNSPEDGDTTITDDYLTGKTISEFAKRAVGSLVPDGLSLTSEWSIAGNVITLLGELAAAKFSSQDTYIARISYDQPVDTAPVSGLFKGKKTITGSIVLDASYRNNRITLNSTGLGLHIVLEDASVVPEGTIFKLTDFEGGLQKQTLLTTVAGGFRVGGGILDEMYVGKMEGIFLQLADGAYDIVDLPEGHNRVGRRAGEMFWGFVNTLAEDFALYNADDYPRYWYWLTHVFPDASYYIIDDNLDNVGYTKPVNVNGFPYKTGLHIISLTKRKFRMPDTRDYTDKAGTSFSPPFGGDASRLYDKPGGLQLQQMLDHVHNTQDINPIVDGGNRYLGKTTTITDFSKASGPTNIFGLVNAAADPTLITGLPRTPADAVSAHLSGAELRINNVSVINLRYV